MKASKRLWIWLIALVLISPVGLILPGMFGAGAAWGEWSTAEIQGLVGYIPGGMSRLADIWNAPMPDYAAPGREDAPLPVLSLWYIISGALGAGAVLGITLFLGRLITGHEDGNAS